ncbi:MAG: hypothetical protein QM648_10825 [Solirubrobacterales bacterium]
MRRSALRILVPLLALAALLIGPASALAWNGYDFQDLGQNLKPRAVNASDQIIGERLNYPHIGEYFYLDDGTAVNFNDKFGISTGAAVDINDAGKIIGGVQHAFDTWPAHPALWTFGSPAPQEYDIPAGWTSATAFAINNSGQSVGIAELPYVYPETAADKQRAWIAGAGGPATSFADDGTRRLAVGISDTGKVLVLSDFSDYLIATTGGGTSPTGLKYLGDYYHPMGEDGSIVGRMADYTPGVRDPSSGLVHQVVNSTSYQSRAINAGTVVGTKSTPSGNRAFAFVDGEEVDLEAALSAGWHTTEATDVNTKGDIIGTAVYEADGTTHGFLLKKSDVLTVKLDAWSEDGRDIAAGGITEKETFRVRVTVKNTSPEQTVDHLQFAFGSAMALDTRGGGGVGTLAAPQDALPTELASGESKSFDYTLTTTRAGLAAGTVKVTGKDEDGNEQVGKGSLKMSIVGAQTLNAALAQYARIQGIDHMLMKLARRFYTGWGDRAEQTRKYLWNALSKSERKKWFGSSKQMVIDNLDRARGLLYGRPAEAMAVQFPNKKFNGYTAEELEAAYADGFAEQSGKRTGKWAQGWGKFAVGVKDEFGLAFSESGLGLSYLMNTASQDQREQYEAMIMTFSDGVVKDSSSYASWTKNEASNLLNDGQAMIYAVANMDQGAADFADAVKAPFERDAAARKKLAKIADDHPALYQRELGALDANIFNTGMEAIADTLIGGGSASLISKGGQVLKLKERGAALINLAKATGKIDDSGKLSKGVKAMEGLKKGLDVGIPGEEMAALLDKPTALKDVAGATLVRSSDLGDIYSLPNVGGVPYPTLESKARILGSIEEEMAKAFAQPTELAEVLKPSTELRKTGAVAKVEIVGQKTGKAAMLDAGMPKDALAEAVLWQPKVDPRKTLSFKLLSKERQAAAIKEYENALKAVAEWKKPKPGSKTAKLKEMVGKEATVPLDDKPWPGGLQRFINGEFELVKVSNKMGEADLIRVKKYELVVKDMERGGKVVNTKTVVNSKKALPLGVDADAVGIAKVIGRDAKGVPILGPLTREESEFVMRRYIDRNIKARAAGLQTDIAEHGATWLMDDADSAHAGMLLSKFGVPFMPEDVAVPFLSRIAKFVTPKDGDVGKTFLDMLNTVRSEGGFGQRAVILTRDTRYFGDLPVNSW